MAQWLVTVGVAKASAGAPYAPRYAPPASTACIHYIAVLNRKRLKHQEAPGIGTQEGRSNTHHLSKRVAATTCQPIRQHVRNNAEIDSESKASQALIDSNRYTSIKRRTTKRRGRLEEEANRTNRVGGEGRRGCGTRKQGVKVISLDAALLG